MTPAFPSLVDRLEAHTEHHPEHPLYTFLDDAGQRVTLSRAEFRTRVQGLAERLVESGLTGKRALLLYPPGLDYIAALWACWYASVVAIPAYPPDPTRLTRTLPRLEAIIADSEPHAVLTDSVLASMLQLLPKQRSAAALQWLATDTLQPAAGPFPSRATPDQLALIQYTSGSTGSPKGVMLSHQHLASNLASYSDYLGNAGPTLAMWLPQYHDMGLIGGLLTAAYRGQHCVYMSPVAFLRRPARWLRAISDYSATYTGAPNFAFELCVRRIRPEECEALDLSSLAAVCVGAEPTQPRTLKRFAQTFASSGFREHSFRPCYGLAEVGLFASGGAAAGLPRVVAIDRKQGEAGRVRLFGAEHDASGRTLIGHGTSPPHHTRLIVEPDSKRVLGEGEVGELWLAGPSIAAGYWNKPELSSEHFSATTACGRGPFLRTGDLGFLYEAELFITGRLKDLVIIRGRNFYAEDLEATVESAHAICRPGCSAAFSIEASDGEQLVVAQEVDYDPSASSSSETWAADCHRAIDDAIVDAHGVRVDKLYLLSPKTIPKTSSGKVQRRRCRQQLESGELTALAVLDATALRQVYAASDGTPITLEDWIASWIAKRRGVAPSVIDRSAALNSLGLDSLSFATLTYDLEEHLGIVITDLHKLTAPVNSISDLAQQLAIEDPTRGVS